MSAQIAELQRKLEVSLDQIKYTLSSIDLSLQSIKTGQNHADGRVKLVEDRVAGVQRSLTSGVARILDVNSEVLLRLASLVTTEDNWSAAIFDAFEVEQVRLISRRGSR